MIGHRYILLQRFLKRREIIFRWCRNERRIRRGRLLIIRRALLERSRSFTWPKIRRPERISKKWWRTLRSSRVLESMTSKAAGTELKERTQPKHLFLVSCPRPSTKVWLHQVITTRSTLIWSSKSNEQQEYINQRPTHPLIGNQRDPMLRRLDRMKTIRPEQWPKDNRLKFQLIKKLKLVFWMLALGKVRIRQALENIMWKKQRRELLSEQGEAISEIFQAK